MQDPIPATTSIDSDQEQRFKLIDFLIKRLDHTITYTQTITRLIYVVNGAILAAVYFGFGKVHPFSYACFVAGVLIFLLFIINLFHANFLHIQHTWYRTIDQEIRKVFLGFKDFKKVWPKHLGEYHDEVLKEYKGWNRLFFFRKTQSIYVWIHLVISIFLLFFSLAFFYMSWKTPDVKIGTLKANQHISRETEQTAEVGRDRGRDQVCLWLN